MAVGVARGRLRARTAEAADEREHLAAVEVAVARVDARVDHRRDDVLGRVRARVAVAAAVEPGRVGAHLRHAERELACRVHRPDAHVEVDPAHEPGACQHTRLRLAERGREAVDQRQPAEDAEGAGALAERAHECSRRRLVEAHDRPHGAARGRALHRRLEVVGDPVAVAVAAERRRLRGGRCQKND
jgi:hypothetical protein